MRTEKEMMSLIIDNAQNDDRVRAVIMNGSRANPNAPQDVFQDYDIVYVVRAIASFIQDHDWIDVFGELIMLQKPEEMRHPSGDGHFTYLMLFRDGSRIDLSLVPIERYQELDDRNSQSILLLDKDGLIEPYPPAYDRDYHIKPPSELDYSSCCNNFWWCSQNVAKGIRRDELPYAMSMYDILRDELHYMIGWYIGIKTNFSVSAGKFGKYYKHHLNQRQYGLLTQTYTNGNYSNLWQAIFTMCGLFRELAQEVAGFFGFTYPQSDDDQMTAYLERVREMPPE